jgi:hypothetical protein
VTKNYITINSKVKNKVVKMPMGIMVETTKQSVKVLKFFGFRKKKTLPVKYISGYPHVFAWENKYFCDINGITVMKAPKDAFTLKPGDVLPVEEFFEKKSLIEEAGNRFHACNDHRENIMTFWI